MKITIRQMYPPEDIVAMFEASRKYGEYPIKV